MAIPCKRVLIIDDENRIRTIYRRVLVEAGLTVYEASNAGEATHLLITEKIDIILLDINMPVVDGKSVFEIIQEYDPSIKVIISSVYPLDVQKKMIPQAKDYHDKSHGASNLLNKVFSAV